MSVQTVILAAGQGKRMASVLPKVLHEIGGKAILERVIETAININPDQPPIIIYGHQGKMIRERLHKSHVRWIEQKEQLGTGHALLQALPALNDKDNVLVLYGDAPLITESTLHKLIDSTSANSISIITARLPNPYGYGRIKRNAAKKIVNVVEEKDASDAERKITEINTGIYLLPVKFLKKTLPKLKNHNKQNEYYLTDVIAEAVKQKIKIQSIEPAAIEEILGINDRVQLAHLERHLQVDLANRLMRRGVTIVDPARVDIRGSIHCEQDVLIDVNVILEGQIKIKTGCTIGANCILRNVELDEGVQIAPNTIVENAKIGPGCVVGPFARIRPDTHLDEQVRVGNFVEIKKTKVGKRSKINHLSYIGDCTIGDDVNVGAGTITCNYDGVDKHQTIIQDDAFIGSGTELVAPVTVERGATIAAGSTITETAPANKLTIARTKQITLQSWERPQKEKVK